MSTSAALPGATDDGPGLSALRLCQFLPNLYLSARPRGGLELTHVTSTTCTLHSTFQLPSTSPIQCVAAAEPCSPVAPILACANLAGTVYFGSSFGESLAAFHPPSPIPTTSCLSFNPASPLLLLTRALSRDSLVIAPETQTVVCSFEHELPALASAWLDAHTFAVCEWGDVSVWDVRSQSHVVRMLANRFGAGEPLYAVAGSLEVGGASRTVAQVDSKKWSLRASWKVPLKHELVGLVSAAAAGRTTFALGLDHELCSHVWESGKQDSNGDDAGSSSSSSSNQNLSRLHHNHRVLRSRARWAGLVISNDLLIGRDVAGQWTIQPASLG